MEVPNSFSLGVDQIVVLSFVFLLISIGLYKFKEYSISKKDVLLLVTLWLMILLVSSLVYTKMPKDGGALYKVGFPHYFYSFWNNLGNRESAPFFNLGYLLVNSGFSLIASFFVWTIWKTGKKR